MDRNPNVPVLPPRDPRTEIPAWIATMPNYEAHILNYGSHLVNVTRAIVAYRLGGPATTDGVTFVYKGVGMRTLFRMHRKANEVGGMAQAHLWTAEGRHCHARIPEYYDSYTHIEMDGRTPPARPLYVCSELVGNVSQYIERFGPEGCIGWSVRQKRSFVRRLALFRLALMQMRSNRIGGLAANGGFGLMPYHCAVLRERTLQDGNVAADFYENLQAVSSEEEWAKLGIAREMDFWNRELGAYLLRRTMINCNSHYNWTSTMFKRHLNSHAAMANGRRFRAVHEEVDAPSSDYPFVFDHNDLHSGFNVMCEKHTPRLKAVIDFETSCFLPYSNAVRDIFHRNMGRDDWEKDIKTARRMPFTTDFYWDYEYRHWKRENGYARRARQRRTKRYLRKGKKISTMNDNNYAAYGTITTRDLVFGDTLDEEAYDTHEPPDALDPFYYGGLKTRSSMRRGARKLINAGNWFYGPVMKLIDEYMTNVLGVPKDCKYQDPYLEQWTTGLNNYILPP